MIIAVQSGLVGGGGGTIYTTFLRALIISPFAMTVSSRTQKQMLQAVRVRWWLFFEDP